MIRLRTLTLAAVVAAAPFALAPVVNSVPVLQPLAQGLLPSAAAFDTARDVRGRNRLVTNPQIRRNLQFQRNPGLRARSFSEIRRPLEPAARPTGPRFTGPPRGEFDPRLPERQLGQGHPSLPANAPTEAEIALNQGLLEGVPFSTPEINGWLTKTSRQPRVERTIR